MDPRTRTETRNRTRIGIGTRTRTGTKTRTGTRTRVDLLLLAAAFLALCCWAAPSSAERLCSVPAGPFSVWENGSVDVFLVEISSVDDVVVSLSVNPEDLFYLRGNQLMVKKGLDYESLSSSTLVVWVQCSREGSTSVNESVEVLVENINDNPPNFPQNHFVLDVNELIPINSSVGIIEASDIDSDPLYYRLESTTDKFFRLESVSSPRILVKSLLDYDLVQKISLVLHVQDTFNGSASNEPFFTAVATVTVNVKDVDNRPPWFQPCLRSSLGAAKLCVSTGYRGRVNLTEKEEGPLVLEPGPVYARDGDRNRSEAVSYKILRGNEGNLFQMDEETGNISMTKAADIVGPVVLTVLASQVLNRDQFSVAQVTIEVLKKSRNPPRFEKERYDGFVYSNSVPESLVLRDRSTNRPFRVRARDEDFASGVNPDVRYEVQYSSYVNVTSDGFVVLKRAVKTESFALQLRAVDSTTGESGTAALSVQVIPAVAAPSPSAGGYRAGDMALLGLIMAALLVLCFIVIGFLLSRLWKGNASLDKLCECLGPCPWLSRSRSGHRDSLQFTNDGFQTEGEGVRGLRGEVLRGARGARGARGVPRRWDNGGPRRSPQSRSRLRPPCSSCGVHTNHVGARDREQEEREELEIRSARARQRRREGQKTVWFKESENSSDIEVEIIPDSIGRLEEETQEELEGEEAQEEEEEGGVVRDPNAPHREQDGGEEEENHSTQEEEEKKEGEEH